MRRLESKPARLLALLLCTVHICVGVILTCGFRGWCYCDCH